MKTLSIFLIVSVCYANDTRPLLTCEAPSFHNQGMACNHWRYDKYGQYVSINMNVVDGGYCGDTIILYKGMLSIRGIIGSCFNTCKWCVGYLKIDAPCRFETALGMKGKGRIDSVRIFHNRKWVVFK